MSNKIGLKVQDTRSQYIDPGYKCRLYYQWLTTRKLMQLDELHKNTCHDCESVHNMYPDEVVIVEHDYMPKRRSLRE